MPDKLVTVATFSAPMSAHIARNQLEAAGILAFLADEATVGTAWHLGTAVGGIKLQVVDSDAERALAELESSDSSALVEDQWSANDTEKIREADTDADQEAVLSPTDETVDRAFRAAILGLLLLPLQYYSLWLLADVAASGAGLTARSRRRAWFTLALDLPIIICTLLLAWIQFSRWLN